MTICKANSAAPAAGVCLNNFVLLNDDIVSKGSCDGGNENEEYI